MVLFGSGSQVFISWFHWYHTIIILHIGKVVISRLLGEQTIFIIIWGGIFEILAYVRSDQIP